MVYCAVPYCKSKKGKVKNISFHELPSNSVLRAQWLKNISRKDWNPTADRSYICSRHFLKEDFNEGKIRKLKPNSYPTVFEDYPNNTGKTDGRVKKLLLPRPESVLNNKILLTGDHWDISRRLPMKVECTKYVSTQEDKPDHYSEIHSNFEETLLEIDVEMTEPLSTIDTITVESAATENNLPLLQIAQIRNMQSYLSTLTKMLTQEVISVCFEYGWAFYYNKRGNCLVFLKMRNEVVTMSLQLDYELNLQLKINGELLDESHPLSAKLYSFQISTSEDIVELLATISQVSACEGVSEKEYFYFSSCVKDCRVIYQTMTLHSYNCQQVVNSNGKMCLQCGKLKHRLVSFQKRKERVLKAKPVSKLNKTKLLLLEKQRSRKVETSQLK